MPISVLVTGASTGIGRTIAIDLAKRGHQVFASVRRNEDADQLMKDNEGIIPVLMDVTDQSTIEAACKFIERRRDPSRPFSVVNNAGIAVAGPIEAVPLDDIRRQFEVNVFGLIAVIQIFLPLVRDGGGRIVNMSSVSGIFASPFLGIYSASKYAVEAISDSLRREVAAQGVKVVVIEPGPIRTPIWEKGMQVPRPDHERYNDAIDRFERIVHEVVKTAIEPQAVADAVRKALEDSNPSVRTIVTTFSKKIGAKLANLAPVKLVDKLTVRQLFGK
jgi:NAD(P)-dependent dehydrogenase (short-subunit alcohol dehydrogenase family)